MGNGEQVLDMETKEGTESCLHTGRVNVSVKVHTDKHSKGFSAKFYLVKAIMGHFSLLATFHRFIDIGSEGT